MVKAKVAKSKFAKRYPKEFQRQMVELHRAGTPVAELSKRFGPTNWAIRRWIKRADRDEGRGDGGLGLTTAEREELTRLRRENKRLQMEREILSNVWSAPGTQGVSRRTAASTFRVNVSGLCVGPVGSGP